MFSGLVNRTEAERSDHTLNAPEQTNGFFEAPDVVDDESHLFIQYPKAVTQQLFARLYFRCVDNLRLNATFNQDVPVNRAQLVELILCHGVAECHFTPNLN
jgi:hypothetical protein